MEDTPRLGSSRQKDGHTQLYYREFQWIDKDLVEAAVNALPLQTRIQVVQHLNDLQDEEEAEYLNYSLPSELVGEIIRLSLR